MCILFLIMVTAALVATAAYFSVVGIAGTLACNYGRVMIKGITLDAGKQVSASTRIDIGGYCPMASGCPLKQYLHRLWREDHCACNA